MIDFKVCEKENKKQKYFEFVPTKECLKKLKGAKGDFDAISIDFDVLNLGVKLYGNTKKDSIEIQKKNAKVVVELYKFLKKAVLILKKQKVAFDGCFYIEGLDAKKNNNDFMIASMLAVRFNYSLLKKMHGAVEFACDYLDKENEINNMCDFKDNKCAKKRELGKDGDMGCCPSFCKYRVKGPCPHKNLACKIFMCDYLIYEKGYYFTPLTIPVLKINLTIFERLACFGTLCKPMKNTLRFLWLTRILTILYVVALVGVIALILI